MEVIMQNEINIKNITVEIRKIGFAYKIIVRGVMFKRTFLTYSGAQEHLANMHDYFGEESTFILKGAA
jgi:hypothetical protein